MLEGGPAVQARVLVLPDPDLHSVLHVGHRVLGVVLAGSGCRTGPGIARGYHTADHGHANIRYQRVSAAGVVHQSHRRVDRRLFDVRVWGTARVRPGQLCFPFRLVSPLAQNVSLVELLYTVMNIPIDIYQSILNYNCSYLVCRQTLITL